jgi:hypothetical protein
MSKHDYRTRHHNTMVYKLSNKPVTYIQETHFPHLYKKASVLVPTAQRT